jgi:hypothetical protein
MLTLIGTILIVLASIGVGVAADRRWGLLPRKALPRPAVKLLGHAPGEAPATAIEVTAGALEQLRRARCGDCKGETDILADDRVTYDDRELLVIHTQCRRCRRAHSTYVQLRE